MLYFIFHKKAQMKIKNFKLKILKFFIICKPYSQMQVYQLLAFEHLTFQSICVYCLYIKSLSTKIINCYNFVNSKTLFALNQQTNFFTKPALAAWGWSYKNYKKLTLRFKNQDNKKLQKATKKLKECYIINAYYLCLQLFKPSLLAMITKIFLLAILPFEILTRC